MQGKFPLNKQHVLPLAHKEEKDLSLLKDTDIRCIGQGEMFFNWKGVDLD